MDSEARLVRVATPADPAGVVLVLHGGASRRSAMPVSPAQLSVLRMVPLAARIARASQGRLAVLRLLNSRRGWDTERTPAQDVEWALGEIADRHGADVSVCLVGHSLGGRAALLAAGRPAVRGVVALAPWVYPGDSVPGVAGTPIVIVHGDGDRIADPARSWQVAERLRRQTRVAYVTVTGGTHSMLGRVATFDGLAAHCAAWMLLGETQGPIVERIAAGESSLRV